MKLYSKIENNLISRGLAFEENDDMVELRRHFGGLKRLWEYERVLLSGVQFLQMDENVCGRVLWQIAHLTELKFVLFLCYLISSFRIPYHTPGRLF